MRQSGIKWSARILLWMMLAMTNSPVNATQQDLQDSLLAAAGALTGRVAETSICMQGTTLAVDSIEAAG